MKNLRILIADDTPANLVLLKAIVSADGHEVLCVGDGEAAIQLLKGDPLIELVITDREMPRLRGEAVVRWVKRNHRAKVILASSENVSEIETLARELGADGWLDKADAANAGRGLLALISRLFQKS